jgi:hypothetical protein
VSWICLKGQISIKRSKGLSNHHQKLTPKTLHSNKPSHKKGTTACKEGPTTLLRCHGLQDPRSVLRKGTTELKEGTTGYRRGSDGNNQGGQQQKYFHQRIRHPQHPHSNKQMKQGPGRKIMKRLICHRGGSSYFHKEAELLS